MSAVMWFREDLRIADNTALFQACSQSENGVIAVFIISPEEWHSHDMAACRVDFILRNLKMLSVELDKFNIPLKILKENSASNIPKLLLDFMQKHESTRLFYNEQYEVNEARRDMAVEKLLTKNGCSVKAYCDQVVIAPGDLLTKTGSYYTVFTPFKKAWFQRLDELGDFEVFPKIKKQNKIKVAADSVPTKVKGFESSLDAELWPAGEQYAQKTLNKYVKTKVTDYKKERDFPHLDSTSKLSPYLAVGVISSRQCMQAVKDVNNNKLQGGDAGAVVWVSELIWREFYKHILYAFPRVCMNRAFRLETESLPWENDAKKFKLWCEGKTGYPFVDAAMRQLHATGWMHNRLRMVVAMFLVKDLLIDWRWGERFFMQHLIDGDFASNNGGWQWSAGTGTDASPYFRIFNPFSQSEKFDPDGKFIRQYCPELAELDSKSLHNPTEEQRRECGYPDAIVDHSDARKKFLEVYKKSVKKND